MHEDMRRTVREGYEHADYAGTYGKSMQLNMHETRFLYALIEHIPQHARILDLGCGIGIPYDAYLSSHMHDVTGIDITQKHIESARRNVPRARFIQGDMYAIPDEMYDAIVSFYAIFHIPREEHGMLITRIAEHLIEGGHILITLGAQSDESYEKDWCGAQMAWSSHDPAQYQQMLDTAGFDILLDGYEGERGESEHHYWVLAKKSERTKNHAS